MNAFYHLCLIESTEPMMKCVTEDINENIEKYTRIVHTLFVKVMILCGAVPLNIVSYYRYFTTDLGPDAFLIFNYMKYFEII